MSKSIWGACPRQTVAGRDHRNNPLELCDDGQLEFDGGSIISGPGIAYVEIGDLIRQTCECDLSASEIDAARTNIRENFGDETQDHDGRDDR